MKVWVATVEIHVGERRFRPGEPLTERARLIGPDEVDVPEKNLEPMRRLNQARAEDWPEPEEAKLRKRQRPEKARLTDQTEDQPE